MGWLRYITGRRRDLDMNQRKFLDFFKYILGMTFNTVVFIFVIYMVYTYSQRSFEAGRAFAASLISDKAPHEVEITIPDGATIDEVADILLKNEIISNAMIFKLENMLKKTASDFDGGTFIVNAAMDSNQLMLALRSKYGNSQDVRVTFLEGYTIKDIGVILEAAELLESADEFVQACAENDFHHSFLDDLPNRENQIEGYLFPDTYMFAPGSDAREMASRLLDRFDEIFQWEYYERAHELGLSVDEVITIASIIEKEIRVPEERTLASAVIHNRLKRREPLGMDATILYALDKRKDRILYEDLYIDSPYNTYMYAGLPIGPISNPGAACIEAALYPADVDYLWYVVKDEETGEHFFTNDYNEFLQAKARYQQKFGMGSLD